MALLCILIIGVFLQGIHGINYFIYPIELLDAVNERNEDQSKERQSESRGADLAHAHGEELNESKAEYEEFNKNNFQLVENNEPNDNNNEQAESKEFNGKNAEQLKLKEDNNTNKKHLRTYTKYDEERIDAIMRFLRVHMQSTNHFFREVRRIKRKGIVYDSLKKIAAYLAEFPRYTDQVLECFHKSKVDKHVKVVLWDQKPNNLLIDVMKDQYD